MIVKNTISALWRTMPADWESRLDKAFAHIPDGTEIFFRADDIGVPGHKCQQMMDIFCTHRIPLHMAVTPAWLSESRWATLKQWASDGPFVWHQHGWRHVNHQLSGKKGEFGTDRPWTDKKNDLTRGLAKLRTIMGDDFQPYFTPPWNRFDQETGQILAELGFKGVSRSSGEMKKVPLPDTLPDTFIHVDLHTRGEADPGAGWDALMNEFQTAATTGRIGVMLHHQRMNDAAFEFLDFCLARAAARTSLKKITFDCL